MTTNSDRRPGHNHLEAGHASHSAAVPSWGRGRKDQGPVPMHGWLRAGLELKGEGSREGIKGCLPSHSLLAYFLICPLINQTEINLEWGESERHVAMKALIWL